MTGSRLCDLRGRIESLASERGEFYLVCSRYGDRPVPADGCRFESRTDAQRAATLTKEYRTVLRGYDSELPCYDIVVQRTPEVGGVVPSSGADGSASEVQE
jgi:hypothetical protein